MGLHRILSKDIRQNHHKITISSQFPTIFPRYPRKSLETAGRQVSLGAAATGLRLVAAEHHGTVHAAVALGAGDGDLAADFGV